MLYIIITVLSLAASFFTPWWSAAPIAFILCLVLARSGRQAFWISFAAVFSSWLLLIAFTLFSSQHYLLNRMTRLFSLPHPALLVVISAAIGGFFAAMAGLSGGLLRAVFTRSAPAAVKEEKPQFVLPEFDLN